MFFLLIVFFQCSDGKTAEVLESIFSKKQLVLVKSVCEQKYLSIEYTGVVGSIRSNEFKLQRKIVSKLKFRELIKLLRADNLNLKALAIQKIKTLLLDEADCFFSNYKAYIHGEVKINIGDEIEFFELTDLAFSDFPYVLI